MGGRARGTVDEKERFREEDEQSRAVFKGNWAVRLARHFAGIRDHRAFPTPLLRPLRHLSPTTEGYLVAFIGSFPSILIASAISSGLSTIPGNSFSLTPLTVGSLGATAVLLYAVPEGPLSQPRNLVGGHVLSAIVGAVVSQLFSLSSRFTAGSEDVDNTVARIESWDALTPVAAALAVSLSLLVMQLTGTVHPPGGATALIAAYHRTSPARWTYLLDVFLAVSAMGIWAMIVVNLGRRSWWTPPATDRAAVIPPPSAPSAPLAPSDPVEPKSPSKRRPSPPSHLEHAPAFSPAEDLERRWLGRLGEVDEEALASGEERARREEDVWNAGKARLEEREHEHEREQERGRRATRGAY
ncbi:hypothetical protein Rhopal_004881-T1 [Rhodotorula paludigena]|uniref:HPP transmembrane region domain-containing protein n=1 Tax=Rhodotorula paludigena TaxID=86838 RepID=A0AAV5GQR9_9BASI|nr:hypothetical protein Rhopal_004881-T1 [Rhodotorula paludigena]